MQFRKKFFVLSPILIALTLLTLVITAVGQTPILTLTVDETQAARRIAFVHEEIRVHPGALALAYPRWIPGEHGPTGPVQNMAAIRIRAGNTIIPWTRDPEEIGTIHLEVPAATDRITVDFDTLMENTISDHQILLAWNTTVLYPRGIDKRELMIEPSIVLPPNWKQGSSLQVTGQEGNRATFAAVSLERLIDSPVLAGEYFRSVQLSSQWPAELAFTGDSQAAVDKADNAHAFDLFAKLVDQDQAMFGFRHWKKMHILVSQSASRPFDGLEHEDSPYNAIGDAGLSKKEQLEKFGYVLLAHEQSHSWDGKYRRPAELYSKPDYQGPEHASLLWVYEGLNEYIGILLATRAGFNDQAYGRDILAVTAADYTVEAGRATTPLVDTATEDWVLRAPDQGWTSLRRGQDYYEEGSLIWLEADTIIRQQTRNQRSLDDFLRAFLGQRDTDPIVVGYTREEVEAALAAVSPYDWHSFFETRIYQVNNKPPVGGIEAAGWRLVYNDAPNSEPFYSDLLPISFEGTYSLGVTAKKDGSIFEVTPGMPAYNAGLGPRMTIISVDGNAFSPEVLSASIARPRNGKISFVVRNFDTVETHAVQYEGGVKYPHLERIPGSHDYLSEILEPRTDKGK